MHEKAVVTWGHTLSCVVAPNRNWIRCEHGFSDKY